MRHALFAAATSVAFLACGPSTLSNSTSGAGATGGSTGHASSTAGGSSGGHGSSGSTGRASTAGGSSGGSSSAGASSASGGSSSGSSSTGAASTGAASSSGGSSAGASSGGVASSSGAASSGGSTGVGTTGASTTGGSTGGGGTTGGSTGSASGGTSGGTVDAGPPVCPCFDPYTESCAASAQSFASASGCTIPVGDGGADLIYGCYGPIDAGAGSWFVNNDCAATKQACLNSSDTPYGAGPDFCSSSKLPVCPCYAGAGPYCSTGMTQYAQSNYCQVPQQFDVGENLYVCDPDAGWSLATFCPYGNGCQDGLDAGFCTGPCPVGLTLCGSSCVDLGSDPQNCGACGHSCGCDGCQNAFCLPRRVTNNFNLCYAGAVAAVGGTLYTDEGQSVIAVLPDGGQTSLVSYEGPGLLYTDGTSLFWSNGYVNNSVDSIAAYDLDAGALNTLFTGAVANAFDMAVDDQNVYWSELYPVSIDGGVSNFASVPKDGGAAVQLPLASDTDGVPFVVDSSNLYYATPIFGSSNAYVVRANKDGTNATLWIDEDAGNPCAMAQDQANVYWLDCSTQDPTNPYQLLANGAVSFAPKATGQPVTLASGLTLASGVGGLLVQGDTLYFANGASVYALALDGGVPVGVGTGNGNTNQLATDGQCLYWADEGATNYAGPTCTGGLWKTNLRP